MSSNPNTLNEPAPHQMLVNEHTVLVYEMLEAMGKRSFVPVLALPALVGLTPLGDTLLFAVFAGLLFAIAGAQLLMGRSFVHLPRKIAFAPLQGNLAQHFIAHSLDAMKWLDETPKVHLTWLTFSPFAALSYSALICVGIALPILGLLGFSTFMFFAAILIYSVSLVTHDGRYTLAAAFVLSFASISPLFN